MARVLGRAAQRSCRQNGTRAWGLGSRCAPIGRSNRSWAWRTAQGRAELPVSLATRAQWAGERLRWRLMRRLAPCAGRVGGLVFHPLALSFDDKCVPVMQQPVDEGESTGVLAATMAS